MSKAPYEKPAIVRYQAGMMNAFGRPSGYRTCPEIDAVSVEDLVKNYGSPLVVFSESALRDKCSDLNRAFKLRYPKVQLAWSYKTNYLKAVCSIMHQEGSWAEVVSEHEYEMAKCMGIKGNKIIYNGPCKSDRSLETAVREKAMINVDSIEEVYALEKIASKLGETIDIGIRINMDTGLYPAWDRFGLNLEGGQVLEVAKRIVSGDKLNLVGFHSHIGTFIIEPHFYTQQVTALANLAIKLKEDLGVSIKYFDIGGGIASKNRLKATYLPTTYLVPDFDAFAKAICNVLLEKFEHDDLPLLIIESGRAIVDEAGSLIATVGATKRLPSGIRALVLDAGVNFLVTSYWYDLDMIPVQEKGSFLEDHVIYGPLCMNIDVIRDIVKLPLLNKGDNLIIRPFGAYNTTQWMQFIRMRPNIIMIGQQGEIDVIRESEDIAYFYQKDKLPKRFPTEFENL